MRLRTPLALFGAALLVLVGPPLLSTGSGSDTGTQIPGLRFMVPNSPGGGYDITARTAAKCLQDPRIMAWVNQPTAAGVDRFDPDGFPVSRPVSQIPMISFFPLRPSPEPAIDLAAPMIPTATSFDGRLTARCRICLTP